MVSPFVEMALAIGLDVVAVVVLGWTTAVAIGARQKPSARLFIALLGALTVWALFSLGAELPGGLATDPLSAVWELGQLGAAMLVPGLWTVYALSYTGRGTGLTWRRVLLLGGIVLPIILTVVVVALRLPESLAERLIASFLGSEVLYLFVLFVYATYLLFGLSRTQERVSKRQIALVTAGVAAPYVVGAAGSGSSPANGVSLGLIASGGLLAVAIRRYPVMTGFPKAKHVARTRVVEGLQEAVVVLDWENHILDANATTTQLFDVDTPAIVGDPLDSIVAGLSETDLSAGATGTVTLQTTKGRRRFQYSVSAVDNTTSADERGTGPVARTVLLRDVTDRETREQRLTVLNRVLRHNVRNKLDIVLAHADLVDDEKHRTGIRESATDLVALSNKARGAEEMMTTSAQSPSAVDIHDVTTDIVEEYRREYPDADVSLTCPDDLTITSHRAIFRRLLSELVENALVHTDADLPTVEITVGEGTDAAVELSVADNGPGIPDRERQILADGTETQLEHGQGLGLWIVNWAVVQLGGDLSFSENDPRGSVVTVRLYETAYSG